MAAMYSQKWCCQLYFKLQQVYAFIFLYGSLGLPYRGDFFQNEFPELTVWNSEVILIISSEIKHISIYRNYYSCFERIDLL